MRPGNQFQAGPFRTPANAVNVGGRFTVYKPREPCGTAFEPCFESPFYEGIVTSVEPVFVQDIVPGTPRRRLFVARSPLPVNAQTAFAWHERPGAFQRLTVPWDPSRIVSQTGGIRDGGQAVIEIRIGPFRRLWRAVHQNYDPPRQFQDVQASGPFALFEHTHKIISHDAASCELEDHIEYRLPFGRLGDWLAHRLIQQKLERVFRYRHHITCNDLATRLADREDSSMKTLITGATGLVGRELTALLTTSGQEVFRLTRSKPTEANDITWNPAQGILPKAPLEGMDAVVHLAGENIAAARWTDAVKERLRQSRIQSTKLLCETLAQLQSPPKTLICASAIGFYGDRGTEILTESSPLGTGFLAELCRDWEAAAEPARQKGIRVVHLRIGVVLSPKGGALAKMLMPFQWGLGGIVGNGRQYWSWVAIDDVIGAIRHCLERSDVSGPINAVSPNPVTNYEFTKTLGGVLHRPTVFPMPAFAARLALGEMADELLLGSNRILPKRLEETGYQFRCPTLESTLRHLLGK